MPSAASTSSEGKVLAYLTMQNRPYSTNDIFMNLHKELGKTLVQKSLDLLVADGKVTEKVNGKQKAYVVNQQNLAVASESELASLVEKYKDKDGTLISTLAEVKDIEGQLRLLHSAATTKNVMMEEKALAQEIGNLEARLAKLKQSDNADLVSKEDKKKIQDQRETVIKEWRKRKRMCHDIVNTILESCPKPKKALFDEIGIETDDEIGVMIPEI